ncbi:MAG: bifunctional pyr operon transcriptional regulator/uracil phosphoribosyltransferase PyrR [Polyangiaceae bacterium]|nr:bifunctional pyr operon transcriptional regulator/uracil phosphoribosyltransferase PyrR [Polyangiaceae bacterium]
MKTLVEPEDIQRGLRRVAGEIVERHRGLENLLLVGIRRGGVSVAEALAQLIAEHEKTVASAVPVGTVDISLYRDDSATALPNPRIGPSELPIHLEKRRVILCDDVLFTGRTVRAALDALLDYGRPASVELAVLLDRGGRELPIQADYLVRNINLESGQRVDVVLESRAPQRWRALSVPVGSPSIPPPPID